jgi:hypothetical protein
MAALTASVAVLTTSGALTERVWAESSAVALEPAGDVTAFVDRAVTLAGDAAARAALGTRGRDLYDRQFALHLTIARLRR